MEMEKLIYMRWNCLLQYKSKYDAHSNKRTRIIKLFIESVCKKDRQIAFFSFLLGSDFPVKIFKNPFKKEALTPTNSQRTLRQTRFKRNPVYILASFSTKKYVRTYPFKLSR